MTTKSVGGASAASFRRRRAQASTYAPRIARRTPIAATFDTSDADGHPGAAPEAVFDRLTGPFGSRLDEEP